MKRCDVVGGNATIGMILSKCYVLGTCQAPEIRTRVGLVATIVAVLKQFDVNVDNGNMCA
jgi:hypothetical protein